MLLGEGHVGEDVLLRLVEQGGELGQLGADLVRDRAPLRPGGAGVVLGEGGGMNADTTRRPLLPAWASALRMKCTRQRSQVARNTRATAALMPSCVSEITSLTPARPRHFSWRSKSTQKVSASEAPMAKPFRETRVDVGGRSVSRKPLAGRS